MAERPLIVLGAGGHAKVLIDLLTKLGRQILMAVEPMACEERLLLGVPVRGGDACVFDHAPTDIDLVLGIGMPSADPIAGLSARCVEARRFVGRGYRFTPVAHPSAVIGSGCVLGEGAQVMAGAVVQPACRIGDFAILNTRCSVDHDCIVGEGSHVAPGVTMGGGVQVGKQTLVGIGATVRQGLAIGSRVLIGGGAMVARDVADDEHLVGVPARA